MTIKGLAHVNLNGTRREIDLLRDFYVSVVGLSEGPRPPFHFFGYWLYGDGIDLLHLTERDAHPAPGHQGIDHFALRASDFAATEHRLSELGIVVRVSRVPDTGVRQIFMKDPCGNGVELLFAPET